MEISAETENKYVNKSYYGCSIPSIFFLYERHIFVTVQSTPSILFIVDFGDMTSSLLLDLLSPPHLDPSFFVAQDHVLR